MTPPAEHLEATAVRLLKKAMAELRQGAFRERFYFAFGLEEPQVQYFDGIGNLLNSGDGKAFLFASMRATIECLGATSTYFITETWNLILNEKGYAALKENGEPWLNSKIDRGYATLMFEGYASRRECLTCVGQTAEQFASASWVFESIPLPKGRRTVIVDTEVPEIHYAAPQKQFSGRSKMFGAFSDEETEAYYKVLMEDPSFKENFEGMVSKLKQGSK